MPDPTTTTARVLFVHSTAAGALTVTVRAEEASDRPRRYYVPAGLLAAGLAMAMEAGEVWTLTLAADGETVLRASYGEGVEE
jgi:uncharacterized membrane protein YhhN